MVLAHMITEAEKSHNLLSRNWRPKEVHDVLWKPESQRANGTDSSTSMKAENQEHQGQKIDVPAHFSQEESEFKFPPPLYYSEPSLP